MYDFISLFLKSETNYNNNGKVLNEWIADTVKITEDIEGIFDFEGDYPVKDSKNFSQYLVRGNILRSPIYDSRPEQLFRIRKTSLDSSGSKISVYAQAIARCDLMNDFVFGGGSSPLVPAGKTRKEAIGLILGAVQDNVGKFRVGNLDTNTNTNINLGLDDNGNVINYINVAYTSPLSGILDNSDNAKSVYKAYSGEVIFNNFTIDMVDERGKIDNPFIIKSGKNLQEFQQYIDDTSDDFATVLIMKSSDGIYLPNNEVITSPNVNILGKRYKVITCEDVSAVDDTPAALNVVYNQLRERGQKKFTEDGIDALTINNTVKFAQLKKTEQYKNYNILEKCELGNNVTIIYEKLNDLTVTARVTRIVYNPLALNRQGKILEVTIGNRKKANIVSTINKTTNAVNTVNTKTNINTAKIKKVKKDSDEFKVTMEARTNEIELSVENETQNRIEAITILDGKIESKVSEDEFSTLIEQNSKSVAIAIHGESDNQVTVDSNGLTVTGGGFLFENIHGEDILKAHTNGAIRLGNEDWRKSKSMDYILLGGLPLGQYLLLSCIAIDTVLDMGDESIITEGTIYTTDLEVSGDKNCVQDTESYGKRLINAYETCEYFFGDIGSGIIKDGNCLIEIDPIFSECINTNIEYHVFTQIYNGSITKIERNSNNFIVFGEEGTIFSWELKAKRRGFENNRLELSKRQ